MKIQYWLLTTLVFGISPLTSYSQGNAQRGAVVGGLGGALAGAAIGKHNGNTAAGALIGGALGLVTGSAIGEARDRETARYYAQQHAYQQQAMAQIARAVSPADVVTMTHNGVSPHVIINHVRQNGVQRKLEVSDVISLHQQGVAEEVITAMQQAPIATGAPLVAPAPAYSAPAPVVVQEHHYVTPVPHCRHHRHYYHRHHHHHHHKPSVHWGISIGH